MDMPCHYTPDVFIELIVAATEALAGCGLATKGLVIEEESRNQAPMA